jgi:hypothetical protein
MYVSDTMDNEVANNTTQDIEPICRSPAEVPMFAAKMEAGTSVVRTVCIVELPETVSIVVTIRVISIEGVLDGTEESVKLMACD